MKNFLFLSLLILLVVPVVQGQDTLLLLSGKTLSGKVVDKGEEFVTLDDFRKGDSDRVMIETYRVFSIKRPGSPEEVLYTQDSLQGNYFSRGEMRYFIFGEQDADRYFRPTAVGVVGFITGAAAGYAIKDAFPYVLAQPFVYTGINLLPLITINGKKVRNTQLLTQPSYVQGYERVARNRKVQSALRGSLAGMAVGIAASLIRHNIN